jgi:uncharacterized membrane protein YoaT (DUF817 family)
MQAILLVFKLETWSEFKVIMLFHIVGTVMEVFKTNAGSWIYPESSVFHIAGVPLFSGFMYAAIGSYIVRVWKLSRFRFKNHPKVWHFWLLGVLVYINFFSHHFI